MENKPWKSSMYYHVLPDFFSTISCKSEIEQFPFLRDLLIKEHATMKFQKSEEFKREFFKVRIADLFPEESKSRSWFSFDEIIRKASEQNLQQLSVTSMMHLFCECKQDNQSSTTQWQKGEAFFVSITPIDDGDVYKLLSFDCFERGKISLGGKAVAMISSDKTDFSLNTMTTLVFEKTV